MIVAQKDAANITCDIHTITCIIFRNHALTAIYGELNIYVNIYVISREQLLFIFISTVKNQNDNDHESL